MGRKPNVGKNNTGKVLMPEKPSVEPSNGNYLVENLHNKVSSQLKHMNSSADGVATLNESTSAPKQVKGKNELQKKPATLKKYMSKVCVSSVRRSERNESSVIPPSNSNHGIEYVEDITASESEKDEPVTQLEKVLSELESEPVENLNGKSLDEKVEYALQKIEALDKSLKLLKSKVDEDVGLYEAPSVASISYRSMYIDSQKKLGALADENLQLTGKLENALGKIDVYEKENRVLIQVLDKMKEAVNAVVISNLARTTEAAVAASTQAIDKTCSASAAKRKRNAKES